MTTTIRSARIRFLMAVGVLLALALVAATATAAPGTMRAVDLDAPSLGHSVWIAAPGGGGFSAEPGRATVRLTPAGGVVSQVSAWCVDPDRIIAEGVDYTVDLQTPADTPALATARFQEAGWLIGSADRLLAIAPDPALEAAAIQVAVWQLTGSAADVASVTGMPALNARVGQLRALAAGRAVVTALSLAGPGPVVAGAPATLTVAGTPGAVVDLSVTAGAATLSQAQVVIGPAGTTTLTVTPSAPGSVVVRATAQGGALQRAAHLTGAATPQDMAIVTPLTLEATATITATAPALVVPAPVPAVAAQTGATMRITKTAPASVRRGRSIAYRLTVTNISSTVARAVVVRDPIPVGTFLTRLPRSARLRAGAVEWHLGDLAPGERAIVGLRLRTNLVARGDILNVGTATAENAATVRAQARTRVVVAPRRVLPTVVAPAVTG